MSSEQSWRGLVDYELVSGSWAILSNISVSTGSPVQILERAVSTKPRRFYRVRVFD